MSPPRLRGSEKREGRLGTAEVREGRVSRPRAQKREVRDEEKRLNKTG